MARPKKAAAQDVPASAGHNSKTPLTEDEVGALVIHHELKIREGQRKVDALMVDLKSARDVVNGQFKRMTADVGYTRKEFEAEVIALGEMSDAEYRNREAKRLRLHRLAGRQVGEQLDLVDVIADTVDEANAAEHDGYRAGRRGDDPTPPKGVSGILTQDWMRGYHAGQEFNRTQLLIAAEVLARPKPGQMAAAPEETAEGDEEDEIEAEVQRLEDAGWAKPTEAEVEFDVSNNGRTVHQRQDEAA